MVLAAIRLGGERTGQGLPAVPSQCDVHCWAVQGAGSLPLSILDATHNATVDTVLSNSLSSFASV